MGFLGVEMREDRHPLPLLAGISFWFTDGNLRIRVFSIGESVK
jgi:hypothetical protein